MQGSKLETAPRRGDPRRAATSAALIEAAERLFAEHGVEAVSTRQIGAEIGALNTNVVAYHFGGKDGLIAAVFHHRLPAIDLRRAELLAEIDAAGRGQDIRALLRAFALPLFEQTDAAGQHSYARFVMALERSGRVAARGLVSADYPETRHLSQRIEALLPADAAGTGDFRMRLAFSLLATTLLMIDLDPAMTDEAARQLYENAIEMAAAAYAAVPAEGGTLR